MNAAKGLRDLLTLKENPTMEEVYLKFYTEHFLKKGNMTDEKESPVSSWTKITEDPKTWPSSDRLSLVQDEKGVFGLWAGKGYPENPRMFYNAFAWHPLPEPYKEEECP